MDWGNNMDYDESEICHLPIIKPHEGDDDSEVSDHFVPEIDYDDHRNAPVYGGVQKLQHMIDAYHETIESSLEFFEKLTKEDLSINWELPKLHTVSNHVIRIPDQDVRNEIKKLGLTWKTGIFSPDEDKIIRKNWKRLCRNYNLPNTPELFAQWRNVVRHSKYSKVRHFVILWLSQGLPHRTPAQVYQRFIHKMGSTSKGRFSDDELEIIESFLALKAKNNKMSTQQCLGAILGRDERSIWRKITLIKKYENRGNQCRRMKWRLESCNKLLQCIYKVVNNTNSVYENTLDLETLRTRSISWKEWVAIGEKMSLSPLKTKTQWTHKLYVQLYAKKPIFKKKILIKLLKILNEKQFKHWVDVDWKHIATNFGRITSMFLWKTFYHFALKQCPNLTKKLHKTVNFLHTKFVVEKSEMKNSRLKRIILNDDQKLIFHPDDCS